MVALRTRELPQAAPSSMSLSSRWPQFEPDEIEAVTEVLAAGEVNALVHGRQTQAFEREFAEYVGAEHAIAVANGTLALELALRSLGIGPGHEVIVPARSFFASASCVVAVGATPVFADIDPVSHNICPASAERMISLATKAIICVHLAGWPCDVEALQRLCRARDLYLVEDCAQAHGAAVDGRRAGSLGDVAAFSFCTEKIISTGGEGGMMTTSDRTMWSRATAYKDHGKNLERMRGLEPGSQFRYVHDDFGSNWRLTEMQSAIGRRQLAKLPQWLARRADNAAILSQILASHPLVRIPQPPPGVTHAWYKYNVTVDVDRLAVRTGITDIVDLLRSHGITCGSGSCPDMSGEGAFRDNPPRCDGALRNAHWLGERNIMFAVDHLFTPEQMHRIGRIVADAIA